MYARRSMQEIFLEHLPELEARRALHPRERRAAQCISECYTAGIGSHVLRCPEGHYERLQYHACRHRSCPRCAEPARSRWIDAQMQRLLPCAHFHVIFTLPHELLPLWEFNRRVLTAEFFDCVRETLQQLMADERRLGASPGLMMSLHTWGRTLSHHPHMHCLLTAGGLDALGQWRACKPHWLLPVRVVQQLFRGKVLGRLGARLTAKTLALPPRQPESHWRTTIRALYRKHWNIEICPPYEHGRGVALYLARYTKGGPLPKDRALLTDGANVSFGYTDHRDHSAKSARMSALEFMNRVLWHAPVAGQHTTRHAGLYAGACKAQHRQAQAALVQLQQRQWPRAQADPPKPPQTPKTPSCPHCRAPLWRIAMPRQRSGVKFSQAPWRERPSSQKARSPPGR